MKLKITNPRIPASLSLIAFLGILVAVFTENEMLSNAAGWLFAIAFGSLVLIYFPILTITLFGDRIKNKAKVVDNIGLFSVSFIVLGIIMKVFHLPAASVMVIIGGTLFFINYLPSWYASKYKENDPFGRVLYFVFCTSFGILIAAFQFKIMHWPGGALLSKISAYSAIFALFPLGLFALLFRREKKYFSIDSRFLFGFILAYILGSILSAGIATNAKAADNKRQLSVEGNMKLYKQKSQLLYDAFENKELNDSNFINNKQKAVLLKEYANEAYLYIQDLKAFIIKEVDGYEMINRDSISFSSINGKANADIPTNILIGTDPDHPKSGPHSAQELKDKINKFVKELNGIIPEEFALELKQSNPFDFNDVTVEDNQRFSWEVVNFDHEPAAVVFTTLTGYQANIRYMEMIVLNELFTKANANNKGNMAAQLAELSMKYETAKNEKKITTLEKDQQLHDLKMQAKDAEISSREQTIAYFVFALIAFGLLAVFVIRSNILRKQANKALAEQKEIISQQKEKAEEQKHLIEEKQKEILDSITYAKRLQEAILPPKNFVDQYLPENFILYKPKDLVAGDFYFMEVPDDKIFIAAADSTGHGVPGAMVSVVCSNALNRALKEFGLRETGKILDKTRELVLETFSKSESEVKDGMDISILCIDKINEKIFWSGANNPLWYVKAVGKATAETELVEVKANKQPIGKTDNPMPFTTHEINYVTGTVFYLFTDGFADQFGGEKGKKFKYKQLEELLLSNHSAPMNQQASILESNFEKWKGNLEQVDDVCIIGIRV